MATSREARKRWEKANPDYSREWRRKNPDKVRAANRKWREAHPEKWRAIQKQPMPTRPAPEWCECCGRLFITTPNLDHDHFTGKFRGWLCSQCNTALGLLGDSRDVLEKAIAYLGRAQ